MYLPKHFLEDRAEVLSAFVREHSLGMLVTLDHGRPNVEHIPMLLENHDTLRLRGHVARANAVATQVSDGEEVLVVFRGADLYVTPSWYATKGIDGKVVPTWNYSVVEVRGRIRWFNDPDHLRAIVDALTRTHEGPRAKPWSITDAPEDYLATMLRAIIGFEIEVTAMIGKFKASQNRNDADRQSLARGLADEGVSPTLAAEIAREPRSG